MVAAKFQITRKCRICGDSFIAKTISSWYCSPRCSKIAYKRRIDEEKKKKELAEIAQQIPADKEYIKVSEAYAMFEISRDVLYRQIRKGVIPFINMGQKQIRKDKTGVWLAEQMDRNIGTVSRWMTNKIQPSVEQLYDIAKHLDVDVKDLLVSSKNID